MATSDIRIKELTGGREALGTARVIRLAADDLGPDRSATLFDDFGIAGREDGTVVTLNGAGVSALAAGTIRARLPVIGDGDRFAVVVLAQGEAVHLAFLDGAPTMEPGTELVLALDEAPGDGVTPMAFAAGTKIRTPIGDARIENLARGDWIVDPEGQRHQIAWIGARDVTLPVALGQGLDALQPLSIPPGTFGEGRPYTPLLAAPRMRVALEGAHVEMTTGESRVLAPVGDLAGDRIRPATELREVRLYHILCENHAVLVANGLPVASLLPADIMAEGMGRELHDDLLSLFPPLARVCWTHETCRPAAPIVTGQDARDLAQAQNRALEAPDVLSDGEEDGFRGSEAGWPLRAFLRSA